MRMTYRHAKIVDPLPIRVKMPPQRQWFCNKCGYASYENEDKCWKCKESRPKDVKYV